MFGESIDGKLRIKLQHEPIPSHFGNHTRRCNAEAQPVATDERCLFDGKGAHGEPIDEHMLRLHRQPRDCAAHPLVSRPQDVESVDFSSIDDRKAPDDGGVRSQFLVKHIPLPMSELFRVVQNRMCEAQRKDHRRRNYRPSEWTTPRLIDPCDQTQTPRTKAVFVREAANLLSCPHDEGRCESD